MDGWCYYCVALTCTLAHAEGVTDAKVLAVINPARAKFGLPPLEQTAGHYSSILQQQKEVRRHPASCRQPHHIGGHSDKEQQLTTLWLGGGLFLQETNQALAVCTVPNPGVPELCAALTGLGVPYCISTTSGKPRVPISVKVRTRRCQREAAGPWAAWGPLVFY